MRQIKTHAAENVIKVLIANKCDSAADRQVTYEEGKKLAESFGVDFFEVSAKNNINITETFHFMAREIKEKVLPRFAHMSDWAGFDVQFGRNLNKMYLELEDF